MASSNGTRTYRHAVTGKVGEYPESLAQHYPALVEVEPDAKPLAFVPITKQAVDDLRAKSGDESEAPDIEEEN